MTRGNSPLSTLHGQLALPTQPPAPATKNSQLRVLPGTTWQHIFTKQAA